MITLRKLSIILVVIWMSFSSSNVLAGGKSYSVVCKGGGDMSLKLTNKSNTTIYQLRFQKAKQAGTVREPNPGECAWLDRPISNKEPSTLTFTGNNPILQLLASKGHIKIINYKAGGANTAGRVLLSSVYAERKFYLKARASSDKTLKITKVGL